VSQVDTPVEKLAFGPAEAAQALGISRSRLYELLYDGTIPSIKLGARRLIRRETLVTYLDELESVEPPGTA
jgi:excisionase family DNA binding protein